MQMCTRCGTNWPDEYFEPPLTLCLPCYAAIRANAGLSEQELREKARKSRAARRRSEEPYYHRAAKIKDLGQFFRVLDKHGRYQDRAHRAALSEAESTTKAPSWALACDKCGAREFVSKIDGQVNDQGEPLLLCRKCSEGDLQ